MAKKPTAWDIARKLKQMPQLEDINDFGPAILDLMKGVSRDVFRELDEKPGLFGYMDDRFYMLRQVRNNREWGEQMFKGFKK